MENVDEQLTDVEIAELYECTKKMISYIHDHGKASDAKKTASCVIEDITHGDVGSLAILALKASIFELISKNEVCKAISNTVTLIEGIIYENPENIEDIENYSIIALKLAMYDMALFTATAFVIDQRLSRLSEGDKADAYVNICSAHPNISNVFEFINVDPDESESESV